MKKNFLTLSVVAGIIIAALSACVNTGPDVIGGLLSGDDPQANDAVRNIRLVSVDRIFYEYDESGRLTTIIDNDDDYEASADNNFKIELKDQYDDEIDETTVSFGFQNSRIQSISSKGTYRYEDGKDSTEGSASFSYNDKGQISLVSCSINYHGSDGYSAIAKVSITLNYDSMNRLVSSEEITTGTETYDGKTSKLSLKRKIEYKYFPGWDNTFYQYTPNLAGDLFENNLVAITDDRLGFNAFAYIGLFGKASSAVPSSAEESVEEDYDGKVSTRKYTNRYSCSFNENGTISSADNYTYWYTRVGTRGEMPAVESNDGPVKDGKTYLRLFDRLHANFSATAKQ